MYLEALKIAYKAHDGQVRKESLVPYIVHPLRVAHQFNDDVRKTIAILHDVVEDTPLNLEELTGFSETVIKALDALSRREGEQHFEYIKRLKENELAREIKIADIVDNLSDCLTIQPASMIKRYNKSLDILIN
jgi:(p)ppGpp synthase/HD superfamily hydrolase